MNLFLVDFELPGKATCFAIVRAADADRADELVTTRYPAATTTMFGEIHDDEGEAILFDYRRSE